MICSAMFCKNETNSDRDIYCSPCKIIRENIKKEMLTEKLENGRFNCEIKIYCPYCGWEMEAEAECQEYDEGEMEKECYKCEKTFNLETNVSVTWSTSKIDE